MSGHPTRRTPENIAYVNGLHSARAGAPEMTLKAFAATYSISPSQVDRCYLRYREGRTDALLNNTR